MSILSSIKNIFYSETRAAVNIPATPVTASNIGGNGNTILFTGKSSSGVHVNQWNGLTCIPVYACIRLLSNTIGYLDIDLLQNVPTGGKRKATEHPINRVMREPNDAMNGNTFRALLESHVQSWGNGYAYIERDNNFNIKQLLPLLPDRTNPLRLFSGELVYQTRVNGQLLTVLPYEVFHLKGFSFDGLNGLSPIAMFRQQIGKHMAYDEFGGQFFANGLNASGILTHPGNLSELAQERLRSQLTDKLTGLSNAHKVMILEEMMKFEKITVNPNDAQWVEAMGLSKEDIAAGIYQVPPHMIGAMGGSTNNNIEQQSIDFKTHGLNHRIADWQGELNRKALREDEKDSYSFVFNMKNLIRGDMTATANYFKSLSGVLEVNVIREELGFNPLPYGDSVMIQSQNIPLDVAILQARKALETPPTAPTATAATGDGGEKDGESMAPDATDAPESTPAAPSSQRSSLDSQYRDLFAYAVSGALDAQQLRQVLSPFVSAVRSMAAAEIGTAPDNDNFHSFVDKYCETMAMRLSNESDVEDRVRYEMHRCRNAVARETYHAGGVSEVRWEGGELNGKVSPINEPFFSENGKRNIYHPPLNKTCRSEIYPIKKGEK